MVEDTISALIFSYFRLKGQKIILETFKPSNGDTSTCKDIKTSTKTNNPLQKRMPGLIPRFFSLAHGHLEL